MAVSRVTLIVLVATVAVSFTAAKSIEYESMDYAHKLLMAMTSGGGEPKAVGPASVSFGRALFRQDDGDDDDDDAVDGDDDDEEAVHQGIELFRADQIFETVVESKGTGRLNVAQQDEDFRGQEIGKDAHYFDGIMLKRDGDDLEFQ